MKLINNQVIYKIANTLKVSCITLMNFYDKTEQKPYNNYIKLILLNRINVLV